MSSNFTVLGVITLSIAVVGAVLGIINTWKSIDRDRLKLKVIPKRAIPVGELMNPHITLCIEVINLSTFPVTINEIGVLFHKTDERGVIINPIIADGEKFPRRLEPRMSFTAYADPTAFLSEPNFKIKCAYAKTDCGNQITGNSPALKGLAKESVSNS